MCGIYRIILLVTFTDAPYFLSTEPSQRDTKFKLATLCVNCLFCAIHMKGETVYRPCNVCGGKYISLELPYTRRSVSHSSV